MVAFLSPVLLALVAVLVAALALGRRVPHVPRTASPSSGGAPARRRRVVAAGTPGDALLLGEATAGQARLGVGHRIGGTFRAMSSVDELVAWCERHPGGFVAIRLDAVSGRMLLESDIALLSRLARRLGQVETDVFVSTGGRLQRLGGAGTWPWSVRDARLQPLRPDGVALEQMVHGEASCAALVLRTRLDRLAAFAAVLLFAAVATAPAWLGSDRVLLGSEGGGMPPSVWIASQVVDWANTGGDLLHSDALFWPQGSTLIRHTASTMAPVLAAPFVAWQGVDGWNPFVFLLSVAAGVATFRLARRLDVSLGSGLAAAAVVVLGPPALEQLGHARPGLLCFFVLPLACERLIVGVDSLRPRDGWLAGGALLLAFLGSWMLGLLALGLGVLLLLDRAVRDPRPRGAQVTRVARLLFFVVVFAVPLIAQAVADELLGLSYGALPHLLDDTPRNALVIDELVRSGWRPGLTWGAVLGAAACLLAVRGRPALSWPVAVVTGLLGVFAIGPWLAPVEGWSMAYTVAPGALAFAWLPLASLLHHSSDLLMPMSLALGLLVALGLDRAFRSSPNQLGLAVVGVVLASLSVEPVKTTRIDSAAMELVGLLPEEGAIAYLPVGMEGPHLLAAASQGRALLGGPGARSAVLEGGGLWTDMMRDPGLAVLLDGRHAPPPPEAWGPLSEKGLRYVIVDNALIHQLEAVGAPEADAAAGLPMLLQASLGPPLISARTLTVYRLP
ncbi:MAG: hypothetical protein GY913_20135 [Proteobacteria bacterium]|nr:hypothetical protein [Pseudomonadota bacterium]MCP4919216.1 hypothetical protein [Pseudomonadota bacterium]